MNKEKAQPDEELKDIKIVDYTNKTAIFKELASAKIWLDNNYKTFEYARGLIKKKNQFYINTWHGSLGIKKMLRDAETFVRSESFLKAFDREFKDVDLMLTNSQWEEDVFRSALRYNGRYERTGHARNDIFFSDTKEIKNQIYELFNIQKDKKLLLYAPSFRDNLDLTCYDINYERLKEALYKKFNSNWVIMTKFHPVNADKSADKIKKYLSDIDATLYPDIQKLMVSSDMMISDYSSCIFDFIFTKRPCFIYASDIKDYKIARGFYYPLEQTPFSISQNNDELENNILNFDYEKYKKRVEAFLSEKNVLEDGQAAKRGADIIEKIFKGVYK